MSIFHVGGFGLRRRYKNLNQVMAHAMSGDTIFLHEKTMKLQSGVIVKPGTYIDGQGCTIVTPPRQLGLMLQGDGEFHLQNMTILVSPQSYGIISQSDNVNVHLKNVNVYHVKNVRKREWKQGVLATGTQGKTRSSYVFDNCKIDSVNMRLWNMQMQSSALGDFYAGPTTLAVDSLQVSGCTIQNTQLVNPNPKSMASISNSRIGGNVFSAQPVTFTQCQLSRLPMLNHNGNPTKNELLEYAGQNFSTTLGAFQNAKITLNKCNVDTTEEASLGGVNEQPQWQYFLIKGGNLDIHDMQLPLLSVSNNAIAGSVSMTNVRDKSQWEVTDEKNLKLSNKNSKSMLFEEKKNRSIIEDGAASMIQQRGALDELDDMIGLSSVKQQIHRLVSKAKVSHQLAQQGVSTGKGASMDMVFSGNPGTGKSAVAQLVGRALYEAGVIKTPKFVQGSRKNLVGVHVGETTQKTHEFLMSALDGCVFIDEAYSLAPEEGTSFNDEAVDQLIADAWDYRDRLIIIMAGYTREMHHFFNVGNPGLKSRFPNWIDFPDYTQAELQEIMRYDVKKRKLNYASAQTLRDMDIGLARLMPLAGPNSGNGRFVNNFVDKISENKDVRLADNGSLANMSKRELLTINQEDVKAATDQMYKTLQEASQYQE